MRISPRLRGAHSMILNALDRDAGEGRTIRGELADELRAAIAAQQPATDVSVLVEALEKARDAIRNLPKDALGNVPDTPERQGWHIRDELIHNISSALATYEP